MSNEKNPITLLVVDDDNITRRLVVRSLSKEGFNIIDAADGQTAIEMCKERSPDLVILDVMMPGMDGYTTCKRIREIADDTSLPIVMLTGANDVESVEKSYQSGATDFITKPVQWALLSQRIKYALRNRDMKQELIINQIRMAQSQKIARLGYVEVGHDMELMLPRETLHLLGFNNGVSFDSNAMFDRIHSDDRELVIESIKKSFSDKNGYIIEFRFRDGNNRDMYILNSTEYVHDDYLRTEKLVGTIQDITRYKDVSKQLEYQLYYDSLTALPNRRTFTKELGDAISKANQLETLLPVMLVSLDDFKRINESAGHHIGDLLLQELASRLAAIKEHKLLVGRFSSHIFALFAENITHIDQSDHLANAILKLTSDRPFIADDTEYHLTGSVGISLYPLESDTLEDLLKGADIALQHSKQAGGNHANYVTKEMNQHNLQRLHMEEDLREAYNQRQFELFYQPQICSKTEAIVGAEALIRWNHPERGFVFPDVFISIAEEIGLIGDIGLWVFRQAAQQAKHWHNMGLGDIRIGINMSSRQFEDPNLLEKISDIVEEVNVSPALLEIEVTESIAINNFEDIYEILDTFQAMGFHTSMDDFGTGYSSLSYLQKLPLNTLKIDRAFVKDIGDNGENGSIAAAILALAHSLGLKVIGEGIETRSQLEFLRKHDCEVIQGYYYSRPLPASEFERFARKMTKAA